MEIKNRFENRLPRMRVALICVTAIACLAAGCGSKNQDDANISGVATTPTAQAAAKQQRIDNVQNNPNIPAAVKAQLVTQINDPSRAPGPPIAPAAKSR